MVANKLAFAALGVACVAAAAGGSYLATRHNAADHISTTLDAAPAAQTDAVVPPAEPVRETIVAPADSSAPAVSTPPPADRPPRATEPAKASSAQKPARPASRPSAQAARIEPPSPPLEHAAPNLGTPAPVPADPVQAARADARPFEPAGAPEPAEPAFEELTVPSDSVIGLQTETTLSSERARIEDRVEARVVRDVRVSGHVAIPAGTRALGSVVVVERGGKMRDRARLGIRFHTLALADGTRLPITTETIYRYGDAPGNGSAAKIGGGAVAGAILGAIIGGGKGAAIGATTGAAGGGAAVMTGDRSEAVFPSGAEVTARILSPISVTVDR
jgi:hypothetical protein